MSETKYETIVVGAAPLVKELLKELEVVEIIDQELKDQPEIKTTYGELSQAVIINRMSFGPKPLYEMSKWAEERGIDKILGIEAEWLDDDRLGAMLDGLAANQVNIWSKLVKGAVEKFELAPEILHADTTSIYFEGSYENEDGTPKEDPNGPLLIEGYNKDGKRKKAQYVLSLVNCGRVPLWYKPWDGNQSDDGVYLADLQELRKIELNLGNVVLVGDKKLCNHATILDFCRTNQQFLAPHPWRVEPKKVWLETWEKLQKGELEWTPVAYVFRNQENKPIDQRTTYQACEVPYSLEDSANETTYELRWVFSWSSHKAEQDQNRRAQSILAAEQELERIQALLGKYDYKDRQTIENRISSRLKKLSATPFFDFTLSGSESDQNWPLTWQLRTAKLIEAQKFDGISLFCTNVSPQKLSTAQVIITYKKQVHVEQSIDFIKSPIHIRPMWLNLPRRIAGLTLLVMIAVLISSLLEYKVRQHIADTGQLLHGLMPENRDNPFPTANKILRAFHDYALVIVRHPDGLSVIHSPVFRPVQQQIWDILFPPSLNIATLSGG